MIREVASGLDAGGHVGQLELDRLKLRDRSPELLPLERVLAGRNPRPSSPSKFSCGTQTFSKMSSRVSLARQPSLSSFLPAATPSASASTINIDTPR